MTLISLPITSIFLALLLIIVASTVAVTVRWVAEKFLWPNGPIWIHRWVMLFFFGLIILFVKVS